MSEYREDEEFSERENTMEDSFQGGVLEGNSECVICKETFSENDLLELDGIKVCAECKPILLRKMQEGGESFNFFYKPAGFWIRFVAVFIDSIIVNFVNFPITIVAMFFKRGNELPEVIVFQLVLIVITMIPPMLYEVIMINKKGATLGKMICGLKVVNADASEEISLSKSFGRYFSKIVSAIIFNIGYLMAGFDPEKRALHDRMCNTRVVYK